MSQWKFPGVKCLTEQRLRRLAQKASRLLIRGDVLWVVGTDLFGLSGGFIRESRLSVVDATKNSQ